MVKRAHMVSKGYISAWADARKILDVLDLQDGRGFHSSYENATIVSYGYKPAVLARDLEQHYSVIEDAGIPAIRKLRNGESLTIAERSAVVAFLDMHRERGQYADQANVRTPATIVRAKVRGASAGAVVVKDMELALGDRLLLAQSSPEALRLTRLGVEQWPWMLLEGQGLATGDGAVLLWAPTQGAEISAVSFPLSPTVLLVMGQDIRDPRLNALVLNTQVAKNSRRWLIGARSTLNLSQAAALAALRAKD